MKIGKILAFTSAFFMAFFATASTFTFKSSDGSDVSFSIPDELDSLVNDYKDQIQSSIIENNVTQSQLNNAKSQVEGAVKTAAEASDFSASYDALKNGVDNFTKDLLNSVSASQVSQNQWAPSWIGYLVPGIKFGLGLDAGVSSLSLKSIKQAADEIGADDIKNISMNHLPLPTMNLDLRVGGFILPFDAGFTFMTLDTSRIGSLDSALSGFSFKYFAIGGDARYAIIKNMLPDFKLSLTAGFYYSKFNIGFDDENNDTIKAADISFKAMTFTTGAQASIKLAGFFVPYGGARFILSRGDLNWSLTPNWKGLLDSGDADISNAVAYFLPKTLKGDVEGKWIFRPQTYFGFAFDLAVVEITNYVAYTFVSNVWNGNISFRFALD